MKGSYVLITFLHKNKKIKINKKIINFKKGYYCYVGSALPNLEKRIERHLSKKKKKHWHIDYFLEYGKIIDVLKIKSNKKIECEISKRVEKISVGSIKGFGSSDCGCESHFYYFTRNPQRKLRTGI